MTFSKGYIYIIQIFRVRGEIDLVLFKKDFSGNGGIANWLILPNVTQPCIVISSVLFHFYKMYLCNFHMWVKEETVIGLGF